MKENPATADEFKDSHGYLINDIWYPRVTSIVSIKAKPALYRFYAGVGNFEAGEAIKMQKKVNDLNKKLEKIEVEVTEGNVKLKLKGAISMLDSMSKIEEIEVNGIPVKNFNKALKTGNKEIMKKVRKLAKSGELGDLGMLR